MPSDISEAVTQDQIAESLLGDSTEEATQQDAVAEESAAEVEGAQTVEGEATQEAGEENADDWLPTEQEKVFPFETIAKYAQRYGYTAEEIEADPRLSRTLTERLNQDIYVSQLRQAQELQEVEQEDTTPARQEPTQAQQMSAAQWAQHVDQVAQRYVSPEIANHFATGFLKAFGVTEAAKPEMAGQLAHVFTSGVLNVLNSVLPDLLNSNVSGGRTFFQDLVEKNYEGFSEMHQMSSYDRAWSRAAAAVPELKGKSLRDVGPQLEEAATKFAGSPEEFENMQFKGKDGQPLTPYQNAVKKYSVLAKMVAGQKLSPQEAKTFVDAGKRAALKTQRQRELGNLGSGKSNGQIAGKTTSGQFQTNNDLFDDEAMSAYRSMHGSL